LISLPHLFNPSSQIRIQVKSCFWPASLIGFHFIGNPADKAGPFAEACFEERYGRRRQSWQKTLRPLWQKNPVILSKFSLRLLCLFAANIYLLIRVHSWLIFFATFVPFRGKYISVNSCSFVANSLFVLCGHISFVTSLLNPFMLLCSYVL